MSRVAGALIFLRFCAACFDLARFLPKASEWLVINMALLPTIINKQKIESME